MKKEEEMRGIFISYIELNNYIKNKSLYESKENIKKIIKNIKDNKFNTIILQIRSHNDAIYKSDIFKTSESIILEDNKNYDVLEYFIEQSKKENIKIYGWMNPYRIGPEKNISKEEWKDTTKIKKINDTYYYNPGNLEVQKYLIEGVKEVIENYKIEGIIFDDYFYPSTDIDEKEYEEYIKNNYIEKDKFHLLMVNNFIKEVNKEIKKINKSMKFGISPEGNIDNNYKKNYADVKEWTSKEGYIDFIMPQLYYGFYNEKKPFYETLKEWNNLITNDNIDLYIALAFYKVGLVDSYAKQGSDEWINKTDIIKRQIIISRANKKYKGFSLFRYDNLFNENAKNENSSKELENVISILE